MRKATEDDFDDICKVMDETYNESIWKQFGPYDYDISCQHIRSLFDRETYVADGALVSVDISTVYHARPIANVSHFVALKNVRTRALIQDMFNTIDTVAAAHNCLAVFFIPDTIIHGGFHASFSNLMGKYGYKIFSNMYWRGING